MTCRIAETYWIVISVGVSIVALGVGDEGVSGGEAGNGRQVVAGVHVDEAEVGGGEVVVLVAGVASVSQVGRWFGAPVAEGVVAGGTAGNGYAIVVAH